MDSIIEKKKLKKIKITSVVPNRIPGGDLGIGGEEREGTPLVIGPDLVVPQLLHQLRPRDHLRRRRSPPISPLASRLSSQARRSGTTRKQRNGPSSPTRARETGALEILNGSFLGRASVRVMDCSWA